VARPAPAVRPRRAARQVPPGRPRAGGQRRTGRVRTTGCRRRGSGPRAGDQGPGRRNPASGRVWGGLKAGPVLAPGDRNLTPIWVRNPGTACRRRRCGWMDHGPAMRCGWTASPGPRTTGSGRQTSSGRRTHGRGTHEGWMRERGRRTGRGTRTAIGGTIGGLPKASQNPARSGAITPIRFPRSPPARIW